MSEEITIGSYLLERLAQLGVTVSVSESLRRILSECDRFAAVHVWSPR